MNSDIPEPGERWQCVFDPSKQHRDCDQHGPTCEIVTIERGLVKFQWLGRYAYLSQWTVAVERFLSDFTRVEVRS